MSPQLTTLCIIFLLVGILLALVVVLEARRSEAKNRFLRKLEDLGAMTLQVNGFKRFLLGRTERLLTVQGRTFRIRYTKGGNGQPSALVLVLEIPTQGGFILEKRGLGNAWSESLGLGRGIQTPDPPFNERFHLASDDGDFATSCFSAPEARLAADALFDLGCKRIVCGKENLSVAWIPFNFKEDTDTAFLTRSVPHVAAMAEVLTRAASVHAPMAERAGFTLRRFNIANVVATIAFTVLVYAGLFWSARCQTLDRGRLILDSLKFGVPVLGGGLALIVAALKRKSWFSSALLRLITPSILFLLAVAFGTVALNAKFDTSPIKAHRVPVLRTYEKDQKGTSYHVLVQSWRPGRATEDLQVPGKVYWTFRSKTRMALVLSRQGFFGREWCLRCDPDPVQP